MSDEIPADFDAIKSGINKLEAEERNFSSYTFDEMKTQLASRGIDAEAFIARCHKIIDSGIADADSSETQRVFKSSIRAFEATISNLKQRLSAIHEALGVPDFGDPILAIKTREELTAVCVKERDGLKKYLDQTTDAEHRRMVEMETLQGELLKFIPIYFVRDDGLDKACQRWAGAHKALNAAVSEKTSPKVKQLLENCCSILEYLIADGNGREFFPIEIDGESNPQFGFALESIEEIKEFLK